MANTFTTTLATGGAGLPAYLTAAAARGMLAGLPALGGLDKLAALDDGPLNNLLGLASSDIDAAMRYQGRKFDESGNQALAFPRIPYGTLMRNQIGLPVIGGIDAGVAPPAGIVIWDWDDSAGGQGIGAAVVPAAVQLATLYQAGWLLQPAFAARLEAINSGLMSQQIGTGQEAFNAAVAGQAGNLGVRAKQIMEKYRLRTGGML